MSIRKDFFRPVLFVALAALPMAWPATGSGSESSDEWREARLTTAYRLNRHLGAFDLETRIDDGVATISGEVDNALQHDLAIEIAKGVEGIEEIDDRIEIREDDLDRLAKKDDRRHDAERADRRSRGAPAGDDQPGFATRVADATITATVKMRLLWNRNTDGLDIDVSTQRGKVTLEGTVDSVASRELIGRIAANTRDVRAVDNRLRVVPATGNDRRGGEAVERVAGAVPGRGGNVSDTWITAKVAVRLANSDDLDSSAIEIRSRHGVVELRGLVASGYERERAPRIAADVYGVREVVNRLRIGRLVSLGG